MHILVTSVGAFVQWLGLFVNMPKSYISAIDFSTGQSVAADHDSITLDGLPFMALLPDQAHKYQAHKYLGVRMTMTGNFEVEQEYVRGEMQRQMETLNSYEVLSPSLKELAIKVSIISVFRFSAADLVPWSRSELNNISKMWSTGYKQA